MRENLTIEIDKDTHPGSAVAEAIQQIISWSKGAKPLSDSDKRLLLWWAENQIKNS